ncbi:MAG: DNRLRE domain-containing protein, partial [Micromonosporaceae bacterium]|nr:DNRLRE domain-containing protein [Micromonosporaceae bacterium]
GAARGPGGTGGPYHAAPTQRSGSAAGLPHLVGSSGNHTIGTSLRGEYPLREPAAAPAAPANTAAVVTPPAAKAAVFDPTTAMELPGTRTENTRTYDNPDGTQTTEFSAGPLNYQRPDGAWAPVDPSLVAAGGAAAGWQNAAGSVDVRFAARAGSGPMVRVGLDAGHALAFGLAGASAAAGAVTGASVTYRGAAPQTDLRFDNGTAGVEETLVLHSAAAPGRYVFPLQLTGLTARQAGAEVELVDESGAVRAVLPAGTMRDSAATPAVSTGVTYTLSTVDSLPALVVTLDRAWLTDPARRFPVRVDPTVNWWGADSTMVVHGGSSTANPTELLVGDQGGSAAASYLKFNGLVSSLTNQTIYGAQLEVAAYDGPSCTPRPVGVYPVTGSWTAGSGFSYPGPSVGSALVSSSFAYGYIALGQSRSACPAKAVLLDLGTRGRDLVQGWVNGQPNNGLSLRASATDPLGWKGFAGTGTANPPTLFVTHSPYNARYSISNPVPNPPVLQNQAGKVNITVTNLGAETWTPSTYYLAYRAFNAKTDKLVAQQRSANLTGNVARNGRVTLAATINAMPAG